MLRRPPRSTLFPTRRSSDLTKKTDAFIGPPMVILVNRYSASASEIVSACLQDHKRAETIDRKSTRLNSSHLGISYAVFCLKKKTQNRLNPTPIRYQHEHSIM